MIVWTDSLEIALALCDKFPDVDPQTVRFTELYRWVMELPEFSDDPKQIHYSIKKKIEKPNKKLRKHN